MIDGIRGKGPTCNHSRRRFSSGNRSRAQAGTVYYTPAFMATASRPGQRAAVTNGRRVLAVSFPRLSSFVAVYWLEAVSRARPEAARGTQRSEYRTGEDVGEAEPLMLMEATEPIGKGVGTKGEARHPCPRRQSGKNRRGMQPKRLPKRSAEGFPLVTDWRDRGRSVVAKRKPRRSGVDDAHCRVTGRILSRPAPYPNSCPCSA